jgi:hypothetical protein
MENFPKFKLSICFFSRSRRKNKDLPSYLQYRPFSNPFIAHPKQAWVARTTCRSQSTNRRNVRQVKNKTIPHSQKFLLPLFHFQGKQAKWRSGRCPGANVQALPSLFFLTSVVEHKMQGLSNSIRRMDCRLQCSMTREIEMCQDKNIKKKQSDDNKTPV